MDEFPQQMDEFLQLGNSKKKRGGNGNTAWGRGKSAPQHLREKMSKNKRTLIKDSRVFYYVLDFCPLTARRS
ncbi:hypothetical protein TNCT_433721 [Trichonephila clavata]|uniref:Uncharacterized protein n=1 Tax=Trichonephila clavata TaxID=2740835 RepID=A0A8X6FA17_TRICU|nr:hypothetical protein TNCT_433721 [Trichonephila clavata]